MKIDIKAFVLSALIITVVPWLILLVWCAVNGFGFEIVNLFEKLHPSGALSLGFNLNGGFGSKLAGIGINTLYMAADVFILSFAFAFFYNLFSTTKK